MTEGNEPERREGGGTEESGTSDDAPHGGIGGQGGEGHQEGTPPVGEPDAPGQTESEAPDDDAQVGGDDEQ
jgi:hypothetical protein